MDVRLWLVIGIYLLLGIWFSFTVPAFETPDEVYHYAFPRHLTTGNTLPVQSAVATGPWEQEGSQAPLYYMLAGALTAGVDQTDFEVIAVYNPRANIGDPLYPATRIACSTAAQTDRCTEPIWRYIWGAGYPWSWALQRSGCCTVRHATRSPTIYAAAADGGHADHVHAPVRIHHRVVQQRQYGGRSGRSGIVLVDSLLGKGRVRQIRLWEWIVLGVLLWASAH